MIEFIKINERNDAASFLAREISAAIDAGKRVLWCVSGGSAIDAAVEARKKIKDSTQLIVMQVDERYGEPGHENSNWQRLLDSGFSTNGITYRPMLAGLSFDETTRRSNEMLAESFEAADVKIGLFGIGNDGHTAGILPDSPAVQSGDLVANFIGPDFQRITMTSKAIARLDMAVAYARGDNKAEQLALLKREESIARQPAQALKLAAKAYIYNDYEGDNLI